MAYSPVEEVSSRYDTADVLAFYNTKVAEALAISMIVANDYPTDMAEDVRTSYTHLAKAAALGPSGAGYFDENANARRHLKRVCLDCYSLAIIVTLEKIEFFVGEIETYSALPNRVYAGIESLKNQRNTLIADDVRFISIYTVDELIALFLSCEGLLKEIREEYGGHSAEIQSRKARKAKKYNLIAGILLGVMSSVVASYLYDYVKS